MQTKPSDAATPQAKGQKNANSDVKTDPAIQKGASSAGAEMYMSQIKPGMPVVCSDGRQLAVADHMEGKQNIKLNKDAKGVHHYIPLSWVTSVDAKIHVGRAFAAAEQEWSAKAPASPAP